MGAAGSDLYAGRSEEEAYALLDSAEYGQLSLWDGEAGEPQMTFLHYTPLASPHRIWGHLAQANPMLKRLETNPRATFWVNGPSAFIPSHWGDPERGVPTSYYNWAQFELEVRLVHDPGGKVAILERLLERYQPEGRHPPINLEEKFWQGMVTAITGLDMRVLSSQSRHKLGQNKPPAARTRIAEELTTRGFPEDAAVAEQVLARLGEGRF